MTGFHTYANGRKVGRNKEWEKRLTLPLTGDMVDRLDAAKGPGEDRLSVIRAGIERELASRGYGLQDADAEPRKAPARRERKPKAPPDA